MEEIGGKECVEELGSGREENVSAELVWEGIEFDEEENREDKIGEEELVEEN